MTIEIRAARLWERLRSGLLICDGAYRTTLSAAGHAGGEALEAYNVDRPEVVRAAHQAFLEAGADILETNTFQGTSLALARHGAGERAAEVNVAGARVAREVAGERAFVAGSIGPTSLLLEPYGDLTEEEARRSFEEQARALAEGGVDLFIIETFTALEEARLAVAAAAATGRPVAASMSFDPNGRTAFGVTPEQAAVGLAEAGAMVVGANCGTVSPREMVDILARFRAVTEGPLMAQPNAGKPEQTESGVRFPESPERVAEVAPEFRALGATIIGGCCGSTAAHIRAVAARLKG